mmetsp:Transcript_1703/g.4939  ORF Transcript_1703/g.4939 Transcript_1703/m.4939 type:complete len:207 (-) Transcript_1703:239-859(-)
MSERKLHGLLDLLNLSLQPAHVRIAFRGRLLHLHDGDHGVGLVRQQAHHRQHLVVQQHRAAWLQLPLVHKRHHAHVVLRPRAAAHDGVVLVNNLLQCAHIHGRSPQIIHLCAILLIAFLLWPQLLLVRQEFLLHQQPVLNPLQLEQPELAFGAGCHRGQLAAQPRGRCPALLASHSGRWWRRLPLFLLLPLILLLVLARRGGPSHA